MPTDEVKPRGGEERITELEAALKSYASGLNWKRITFTVGVTRVEYWVWTGNEYDPAFTAKAVLGESPVEKRWICTCESHQFAPCRGQENLGDGWVCAVKNRERTLAAAKSEEGK